MKNKSSKNKTKKKKLDLPAIPFSSTSQWERWLDKNHASSPGVWLAIFKKDFKPKAPSYTHALDIALCYGWIDGIKKKAPSKQNEFWLQKFTARRPGSRWSKLNTEKVKLLIQEGKMKPPGLQEVDSAKKDGRWEMAYDSPKNAQVPQDLLKEIRKDAKAFAFFKTLNRTNIYAIAYQLQTARKSETREKRFKIILEMMKNQKKFHP